MIERLELTYFEKVILCSGDTTVTYKLSDISLDYEAIFDKRYAKKMIGELYAGAASIPYNKATSIHYQDLPKKGTAWKIEVNNLSIHSL